MHCSRGGFPQLDQLEELKVEKGALQALPDLEIRYFKRHPVVPEEFPNISPFLKIDIVEITPL